MARTTNRKTRPRGGKRRPAHASVRVRMYRTGLGDCHLLTFPGEGGRPFHMLVDCGVFARTPNEKQVLRDVATDIKAATGGTLDVVAGTHEHYDHLIGFKHARDIFESMTIREVWMSWIEKPGEPRAAWLRTIEAKLKLGLQLALGQALADPALAPRAAGLRNLLEFGGNPLAADYSKQLGDVKDWLRDAGGRVRYLEPHGESFEVVPGVTVYPLGPPLAPEFFRKMDDSKRKPETYGTGFALSGVPAFAGAPEDGADDVAGEATELAVPFDRQWRIAAGRARSWRIPLRPDQRPAAGGWEGEAFFANRYGFRPGEPSAWRRIGDDWLTEAENLALQLDSLTNNSSLALAIEVGPSRRVILMAADAQVGNWLSWHEGTWTTRRAGGPAEKVGASDLLGRTVLYKVGHHASHNATLRQKGLELMTSDELVAMIPVNQTFANDVMHWEMPFPRLLTQLKRRTQGRVVRVDSGLPKPNDVAPAARQAFFARASQTDLYVEVLVPMK